MSKLGYITAGCLLSLVMVSTAQAHYQVNCGDNNEGSSSNYSRPASDWTIGFEDDSNGNDMVHGQIVDNEYALGGGFNGLPGLSDVGVQVRTQNYGENFGSNNGNWDYGVVFDTGPDSPDRERCRPRDQDLWAGFDGNTYNTNPNDGYNPGNVLIIQENDYGCDDGICNTPDDEGSRPAGFFEFEFSELVDITSIDFFDIEGAENNDNAEIYFWTDVVQNDGSVVEQLITNDDTNDDHWHMVDTGDNGWTQIVFNVEGVSRFRIEMGGSGAIDNISGNRHAGGGGQVPEPGTLALFGFGLALMLWMRRRSMI
ncbi:PEP-CTERM sorting domain-containing protein [Magnetospira sp. QH-2]|uniref:PEP-CTERM sorting domain-containing protein n=1 Tax=Magnetospira sp. (strain QH-2) TaxID=1288970 RepID=UPI0003E81B15|nr:PEP-CTERM sorting domain-containing protein [Magnetospira sp. QH-2]CCQ72877.1 conserved exported protein of unknown function [Magnetospira sp. QH-2]